MITTDRRSPLHTATRLARRLSRAAEEPLIRRPFPSLAEIGFHSFTWPHLRSHVRAMTEMTVDRLYLHVPYCAQKCAYCCLYVTPLRPTADRLARFGESLAAEVDIMADLLADRCRPGQVRSIHFGGGSPTLLPLAEFERVLARLRARFGHLLAPDLELFTEPHPAHHRRVIAMGDAFERCFGDRHRVTRRFSMGVQSVDPAVLRSVGRSYAAGLLDRAIAAIQGSGATLACDVLYQLPEQQHETVMWTLRFLADRGVEQIALYRTDYAEGSGIHGKIAPYGPADEARNKGEMTSLLQSSGYRTDDGVYHYRTHPKLHHTAALGFGPAALTYTDELSLTGAMDVGRYTSLVRRGMPGLRSYRLRSRRDDLFASVRRGLFTAQRRGELAATRLDRTALAELIGEAGVDRLLDDGTLSQRDDGLIAPPTRLRELTWLVYRMLQPADRAALIQWNTRGPLGRWLSGRVYGQEIGYDPPIGMGLLLP